MEQADHMEVTVQPGIHRSPLPWTIDGGFLFFGYHGSHSRLLFRSVELPPEDDDGDGTVPTTDVMFIGVRRVQIAVTVPGRMVIRAAAGSEVGSLLGDDTLADDERLFVVGAGSGQGWVVAAGVRWTTARLPFTATNLMSSPLLADLDFSDPDFSWERTGCAVVVAD